jgi:hypothetical protein
MPRIELLDPTQNGRPAEHLENKLGHLIVGQEEAIHQIVRAYQTHVAGLRAAGLSEAFCSWGLPASERLASYRQPPNDRLTVAQASLLYSGIKDLAGLNPTVPRFRRWITP